MTILERHPSLFVDPSYWDLETFAERMERVFPEIAAAHAWANQQEAYQLALVLVAEIDYHLANRTRHYRNRAGRLLTCLDEVVNAILEVKMYLDSTSQPIKVGDRVRFRGREYTIKRFLPDAGRLGTAGIEFNEHQHTPELADEISVDLIKVAPDNLSSNPAA